MGWTDAARKAAAEARKHKGKGGIPEYRPATPGDRPDRTSGPAAPANHAGATKRPLIGGGRPLKKKGFRTAYGRAGVKVGGGGSGSY